jgi:elongation factor G
MDVEVVTPEEYMGDVIGDINRRRGTIQGMEDGALGKQIACEVPLSEMFGYVTDLRSMSQGRASSTMKFKRYMEAPSFITEQLIKQNS